MKVPSLRSRILSALLYADLFQYPLTLRELVRWTPCDKPVSASSVERMCTRLREKHTIGYQSPFFFLPGTEKYIGMRTKRMGTAEQKMRYAFTASRFLRMIPTIMFVGVTGSVAIRNAKKNDDVDLLIIAKSNTVWMTRFLATVLLDMHHMRRHPLEEHVRNKICLNMFMSDDALAIPKQERGWYTAHELLQCVPMWDRGHTYRKLLQVNRWVNRYFFGAWQDRMYMRIHDLRTVSGYGWWFMGVEPILRWIQLRYMAKHRTTEVVTDSYIRFHPKDMRSQIQKDFTLSLRKHKVPLDNIFS